MNQNLDINDVMEKYYPDSVLVTYKTEKGKFYCEIAHYFNGKSTGFSPLNESSITNMIENINVMKNGKITFGGIIPTNVIYADINSGNFKIIWYRKSQIKKLYFDKRLKITDFELRVPPMIYCATRDSLSIYCTKTNSRPTLKTKLYTAPYPNIFTDGKVCLGNCKVNIEKDTTIIDVINNYETSFWQSKFTDSGNVKSISLLKSLSKEKQYPIFDKRFLIKHPICQTLNTLIYEKR